MKTTMRYVHPSGEHIREAIEKARTAAGVILLGISRRIPLILGESPNKLLWNKDIWSHPPGLNRRPADYEEQSLALSSPFTPYRSA